MSHDAVGGFIVMAFLSIAFLIALFLLLRAVMLLKPGEGTQAVFADRTKDQIWDAAQESLKTNKLYVVEESKEKGIIKAQADASAFSYGELVGIFISKSNQADNRFVVEVLSKKVAATTIGGTNWERPLIDAMRKNLNLPIE